MNEWCGKWASCELVRRVVRLGREEGLLIRAQGQPKLDYINFGCPTARRTKMQIHKWLGHESDGVAVVFRDEPPGQSWPRPLKVIEDFSQLSGDAGPNRGWLRSDGPRQFCVLPSAHCIFIPNELVAQPDAYPAWEAIRQVVRYLAQQCDQ